MLLCTVLICTVTVLFLLCDVDWHVSCFGGDVVESQPQGSGAAVEIKRTDLMLLHSRDGSTGQKVVQFIPHRELTL